MICCLPTYLARYSVINFDVEFHEMNKFPLCISGLVIEKTYLLKCHHVRTRSTEPHTAVHSELSSHPFVKLADQQIVKSRQKRQLWRLPQQPVMQPTEFEDLAHFNDER